MRFIVACAGKPKEEGRWGQTKIVKNADGSPQTEYWHWGDMQVRAGVRVRVA